MIAANYTEFRNGLKKFLNEVELNNETLLIKRNSGGGAVMISLKEYNSMMETMHLLSTKANADKLYNSIREMENGNSSEQELIEK
ncbi:MAG: type II toxin-antitoxin system prevent-host-death family antitoxin [Melioribacteraceae bacterium]|jgi:antitoxin YefM|nr:prevent-host-death protein [Ignavibacteriota bacterium]MBZ0183720.1 type II toxin-antitoxin system prevent-host-death family antitoxin [Melioribacteraceae bacterium]|tara:strand:- start:107 stop:361 length:255 start_codon:yes stop_codon:yes gene_type:complete